MKFRSEDIDIFESEMCPRPQFKLREYVSEGANIRVPATTKVEKLNGVVLYNGNCMDILPMLPANSIDSCVTDGPYHLTTAKRYGKKTSKPPKDKDGRYSRLSRGFMGKKWDGGNISFQPETWKKVRRVLKPGAYLQVFGYPRTVHRLTCAVEDAGFIIKDRIHWLYGQGFSKSHNQGNGIGTGLKPGYEPIVLAQKPISEKNIKENIKRWGTEGLNIDACRIGSHKFPAHERGNSVIVKFQSGGITSAHLGRHPSNVIISEQVAEDLGDKARYFYCPKVSTKERNAGCENLKPKPQNSDTNSRTYNDRCGNCGKKFMGFEKTRCHCPPGVKRTDKSIYKNQNNHPTVKPVALMEYLVKLVTPRNGIVLDCFMGCCSTGSACVDLGFHFIGIEIEAGYFDIAVAKIKHAQKQFMGQRWASKGGL